MGTSTPPAVPPGGWRRRLQAHAQPAQACGHIGAQRDVVFTDAAAEGQHVQALQAGGHGAGLAHHAVREHLDGQRCSLAAVGAQPAHVGRHARDAEQTAFAVQQVLQALAPSSPAPSGRAAHRGPARRSVCPSPGRPALKSPSCWPRCAPAAPRTGWRRCPGGPSAHVRVHAGCSAATAASGSGSSGRGSHSAAGQVASIASGSA